MSLRLKHFPRYVSLQNKIHNVQAYIYSVKALGTESAELTFADQNEGVTFSMVVPGRICLPGAGDSYLLPVSSALAIFDDLSTYCFLIKDKNCRSGVSIDLSAEILQDIPAGSKIHVVSQVSKIGRTIGFSDLHMYNDNQELVARGFHTKYLPMGTAWDVMNHPAFASTSLRLYESMYVPYENTGIAKALAKLALGGRNREMVLPVFDGNGSVFQSFGLESAHINDLPIKSQCKHAQEVVESNAFLFRVHPFMCNIRGYLHGGCVGMAIEDAILRSNIALQSTGRLNQLSIQYLNGMKVQYLCGDDCAED